jgi:hypothetical protein
VVFQKHGSVLKSLLGFRHNSGERLQKHYLHIELQILSSVSLWDLRSYDKTEASSISDYIFRHCRSQFELHVHYWGHFKEVTSIKRCKLTASLYEKRLFIDYSYNWAWEGRVDLSWLVIISLNMVNLLMFLMFLLTHKTKVRLSYATSPRYYRVHILLR